MDQRLPRPPELFDRVAEWADLAAFTSPGSPDSLRLGVVYGRRRQGKSEILQHLCDATGGLYTLALAQHSRLDDHLARRARWHPCRLDRHDHCRLP